MFERRFANAFDFGTLLTALALVGVGLVMLGSLEGPGASSLAQKQVLALALGLVLFLGLWRRLQYARGLRLNLYSDAWCCSWSCCSAADRQRHSWIELGQVRLQRGDHEAPDGAACRSQLGRAQ